MLTQQTRLNMDIYQTAIRFEQVKKQISALEKEKADLRKTLLIEAPQHWIDNPKHGVIAEVEQEGVSLKFQWQKKSAYTVSEKYTKYITPTFSTNHGQDLLDLVIPPMPIVPDVR